MRTRSVVLPFVLAAALACGQKPTDKNKDKKDPLLIKPPTNNTQPVSTPTKPDTKPVTPATTMAASTPTSARSLLIDLPTKETYLAMGTEVDQAKTFTYNFEKEQKASYQLSLEWRLKGEKLEALGNFYGKFTTDLTWVIKDVDAKGEAQIEITYGRIQAEYNGILGKGGEKFDSKAKDQTPGTLLAPFGKMDGKTFSMKISKEGKISSLTGQDKILEEALSDPAFPAALKLQIIAGMGEKGLQQLLGQGFLAFPTEEMKKGYTFGLIEAPLTIPALGQVNIQETVTLEGLREIDGKQQGLFSLAILTVLDNTKGGPSLIELPPFTFAVNMTESPYAEGFFMFDLKRGLPALVALPILFNLELSSPMKDTINGEVTLVVKLVE